MTRHGLTEPALSTVDCTGIQLGNEGIDIGTWEPSEREFERPTLPGEEHTEALKGRNWRDEMNAIALPFGNPEAIRLAQIGNAAYARARELGYSRMQSSRFADLAKREAADWESPAQVAARVVEPPHTPRGPGPGGGTPGAGVAA